MIRLIFAAAALLALSGCSTISSMGCASGFNRAANIDLVFGRNMGSVETVSDADWARFVDEEIAPRFPQGFTVLDGKGQWQNDDGTVSRERSKLLHLVLRVNTKQSNDVRTIRDAYMQRYHQEAVLLTVTPACVSFK